MVVQIVGPSMLGNNDAWFGILQFIPTFAMDGDAREQVMNLLSSCPITRVTGVTIR